MLKRISKRLAIDYLHRHSNYILEGTTIDLGRELLVAQAQLEADQAVIREIFRDVGNTYGCDYKFLVLERKYLA